VTVLTTEERRKLEKGCVSGRRAAEASVRAALTTLGVADDKVPSHLGEADRSLRRGLRAKLRQLGHDPELLVAECAFEQWHRLLFARFLAENNLLIHPDYRAPVTIDECEELAAELGEPDGWAVAGRFATQILPGIFRVDDPCVQLRLAPEGRIELERLVSSVPKDSFLADDALGWVYQFWQKDKKDEVNASERKIGGADLGPVTQLFTENYMVRFLLENSLGAWWAARHPDSGLIKEWEYLRFDDEDAPAAGAFEQWPKSIADVTVMDPCCGSGHFLVEAFQMLWRMRVEEERMGSVEAQDAVLRDNLFGLELDPRCVQIAMFAVALQAWKSGGGWRELPTPNIACSGIPVNAPVEEWKALANGDARLENALVRLHILFRDADTLGSLIDPKRSVEAADPTGLQTSFDDVDWDVIGPLLEGALVRESDDPAAAVLGANAAGIARAADYLTRYYTLASTNPPFLSRGAQAESLRRFTQDRHRVCYRDLATTMASRMHDIAVSVAAVLPQHLLFTPGFRDMRRDWIVNRDWHALARLGPAAFETITGEVVQVVLWLDSTIGNDESDGFFGLDVAREESPHLKAASLRTSGGLRLARSDQLGNPDSRILFSNDDQAVARLFDVAESTHGMNTKDQPRFVRYWWEPEAEDQMWERYQTTVGETCRWGGCTSSVHWEQGRGALSDLQKTGRAILVGSRAYGRPGILVSLTGDLRATLYSGGHFSQNSAAISPRDARLLPAIWSYLSSGEFASSVRELDDSLKVPPGTVTKVPFDEDRWRQVAEGQDTDGLTAPWSNDPTQWLFEGRPEVATESLQVAVGRLLGFRWPEQADSDDLDASVDEDGIVCLPPVLGEPTAADRLQELLARAFGSTWSPARTRALLEKSGSKKKDLESWLRDDFFKAHCKVFKTRPFIWQIWDGRKDGFSVLVNYHKLDRATLERLTYTYLGDWIERQAAGVRDDVAGAEERLAAAQDLQQRLEQILEGEPPFDIYVRWKTLVKQPMGWEPDLNDGVRLNVRPFVEAGVLRNKFAVHWKKDRGKNPDGSERLNDLHFTLAEKQAARKGDAS